jgi:hypothetical protein
MGVVIQLNSDQQEALERISGWWDEGVRVVGLYGGAGTGKTMCAGKILKKQYGRKLAVAPTNTAVKQLRLGFRKLGLDFPCSTVASALKLRPTVDANGKRVFESKKELAEEGDPKGSDLEDCDILLVDESSMISPAQIDALLDKVKPSCKVIFLCGKEQLPAVGYKPVKGENKIYVVDVVGEHYKELKKPERYSEEEYIYKVIVAAKDAVNNLDAKFNLREKFNASIEGYKVGDTKKVLSVAVQLSTKMLAEKKYDLTRVICWRKKTVDAVNREIRAGMFPGISEEQPYLKGELLVCSSTVQRGETIIYPTASLLVVETTKPIELVDYSGDTFRAWETVVFDPDEENSFGTPERQIVTLLDLKDKAKFEGKIERLRNELSRLSKVSGYLSLPWKVALNKLKDIENLIDPIRHSYAITAHSAQGMSVDYSIFHHTDNRANQDYDDRNRGAYVAVSRARKYLIVM